MKFLRALFGKKGGDAASGRADNVESLEQSYRDTIGSIVDENGALPRGQAGSDVAVTDILTNINTKVNAGEAAAEAPG